MRTLKTLITTVASLVVISPLASAGAVNVELKNVQDVQGSVMIALFADAETWKSSTPIMAQQVAVTSTDVVAAFEDVPAGSYAIKLFHDVDGNGELKTGRFGIPVEPYGFSNNAKIRFGPPKFADAEFSVGDAPVKQTISLK